MGFFTLFFVIRDTLRCTDARVKLEFLLAERQDWSLVGFVFQKVNPIHTCIPNALELY